MCLAGGTLLRCNQDDTIRSGRAIQGGCRRTGQCRDALDVVGVKHSRSVTGLAVAAIGECTLVKAALGVHHGHTVDDVEHVVVAVDRLGTTHHHTRGTTDARCSSVNLHTSHLTVQRIHEVGILNCHHGVGIQLLHVVGKRLGFLLDTQGGHHHLVQAGALVVHSDHDAIAGLHFLVLETNVRDHERGSLGSVDREVTVDVGNGVSVSAFHVDGGSDNGLTSLVEHPTAYMILPCLLLLSCCASLCGHYGRHACRSC